MEFKVHGVVLVPLTVRLTGAVGQLTVSPLVGFTIVTMPTVPAKLSLLVMVMERLVPVAPELKLTGALVETVKSPT